MNFSKKSVKEEYQQRFPNQDAISNGNDDRILRLTVRRQEVTETRISQPHMSPPPELSRYVCSTCGAGRNRPSKTAKLYRATATGVKRRKIDPSIESAVYKQIAC
jgi:hypothetical protein